VRTFFVRGLGQLFADVFYGRPQRNNAVSEAALKGRTFVFTSKEVGPLASGGNHMIRFLGEFDSPVPSTSLGIGRDCITTVKRWDIGRLVQFPSLLSPDIAKLTHTRYPTWRRNLFHNSLFCQIPGFLRGTGPFSPSPL